MIQLVLESNNIDDECLEAIDEMLKVSKSLTKIDLSCIEMSLETL
jgi:hypothetical protein